MVSLLRSFRKKPAPAMITSADFQQEKNLVQPVKEIDSENSIFGLSLEKAYERNEELINDYPAFSINYEIYENKNTRYVPIMIIKCLNYINAHGLREEGLYRVSGSNQDIMFLKNGFNQHGPSFDIPEFFDIHAVTSLVKMYIRELPEDLLPVYKHTFLSYTQHKEPTDLSNFNIFTQEEEDLNPIVIPTQILQEILQELPIYNFALVQHLSLHFQEIIQNTKYNKMTLANLSIILCHTFKIHKSVFHALVLKENLWDGLCPASLKSFSTVFYDTNKILYYEPTECPSPELESDYSDDTQTSFTSISHNLTAHSSVITSTNDYYYNNLNNSKHISFIDDFNPLEPAFDETDSKINSNYTFEYERKRVRHPIFY